MLGITSNIFFIHKTKARINTETVFEFEIIGYNGSVGLVGIPLPPDYNGTIIPEGDTYSYDQLIFRITYRGTTKCTITKILLWQEFTYYGSEYNYTGVKDVEPPGYSLKRDQSYEFLVDSGPWPQNFHIYPPITIRMFTENQGDFLFSIQISDRINELTNWKPQNSSQVTGDSIFTLIFTLTCIIGKGQRRIKKKDHQT